MAKIVIISGSPVINGNTDILVQAFADGIDRTKNTVEIISVVGKNINGCIGCDCCFTDAKHDCVIKDDMKGVYASLADADVIVAATPLYFYGVSSQLKSLIDRLHNPIRNSFKVKKLVLLAVGADTKKEVFDSLVTAYKAVLKYFSLENGGIITVNGMKNKGDIRKDAALDAARELASSL